MQRDRESRSNNFRREPVAEVDASYGRWLVDHLLWPGGLASGVTSVGRKFTVSPTASPAAGTTGTGVLKPSKAPMRAPVPGNGFARTGNDFL